MHGPLRVRAWFVQYPFKVRSIVVLTFVFLSGQARNGLCTGGFRGAYRMCSHACYVYECAAVSC